MAADSQINIKSEIENIFIEVAKSNSIENYELKLNLEVQMGDGFVGHFYSGKIINKDSGEITNIAIKKAPSAGFDFSLIFKNEALFYSSIYPTLTSMQEEANLPDAFDNVPKLLGYGLELKQEYLAMEDLKAKGFVLFDKKKYLDNEHLQFIFRVYGKFHALSFALRKQNPERYQEIHQGLTDLFHLFADFSAKQFEDSMAAAVNALDPKSAAYEEAKDFPKNVVPTLLKEAAYSGQYRCSTHGDCWSNNMMFKYSESGKLEDMKLIDFQIARDSSPIHDLSYFFYSGASKAELDDLEKYLKIYHNSLSEVLKQFGEDPDEIFSYKTLIKEWKENALMGVFLGVYLWQVKLLEKEEYKDGLIGTMEERMAFFSDLLSKTMNSDTFKERARGILIHAYEFGVLRKDKLVKKVEEKTTAKGLLTTEL